MSEEPEQDVKEPIILLHGALGCQNQLSSVSTALKASYDVHTLNFDGHGGKQSTEPFSIDLFTQNVLDYCTENNLRSITIFGYSMGGYVALNLALKQPHLVKKIFTLGTKFNWDMASAKKEVIMLNPAKVEEKIPLFAEHLKNLHHPLDWKQVMTQTADMMLEMGSGAKLVDDDFKHIQQEVVIGIGELDHMVTYEESEYVNRLLPNSTLVQLEGVKHPIETVDLDKVVVKLGLIKAGL